MATFKHIWLAGIILFVTVSASPQAAHALPSLMDTLAQQAPNLDKSVLEKALNATECARRQGISNPARLAIIDYSLPSSDTRLWIFDLEKKALVLENLVAHGKRSGNRLAHQFSNRVGSHQSSIGLFRSEETYVGKHGYSLRMDGLEPGFNDRARDRAIVIHGADYVNEQWINRYGRIGRSLGCPAVPKAVSKAVVDSLKEGQLVFSYYPDPEWLNGSEFLNCNGQRMTQRAAGNQNVKG